jgi:outer membrane biosynthesis protein TonB
VENLQQFLPVKENFFSKPEIVVIIILFMTIYPFFRATTALGISGILALTLLTYGICIGTVQAQSVENMTNQIPAMAPENATDNQTSSNATDVSISEAAQLKAKAKKIKEPPGDAEPEEEGPEEEGPEEEPDPEPEEEPDPEPEEEPDSPESSSGSAPSP